MSNKEKIYKPTVKLHQFEYQLTDETNQTIITFPIPPGTTKEAIQVDQGENHLSVGLKGSEPIVCGILFGPIDVKKSRTIFDTNGIFMIMLIKKNPIKWPLLIFSKYKGHIDPHSLVLKAAFYEHNNEYSVSLDLLKMAADKKHFTAIFKLAAIYTEYSKFKIKLDFPLALKYWKMGSDLGHSDSSLMVGHFYFQGIGCTKDYKKAVEYYKLAVLRGCDDAHLSLSVIYEKGGFGTEIDLKKSFKHLLKSKYSKSPEGCIQIAKIYANGKGVEKNINLCKEYILKAQKKNPYIFIPQELQKFLNENDNQAKKGVNNLETKQEQPSTQMKQRNENENNRKSASKLESKSKSECECESEHQEIELKQPRHFELETKKPIFSSLFTFGSIIVVSSICLYNELKSNSKNNKNNLDN